jgi:hypothetical protein
MSERALKSNEFPVFWEQRVACSNHVAPTIICPPLAKRQAALQQSGPLQGTFRRGLMRDAVALARTLDTTRSRNVRSFFRRGIVLEAVSRQRRRFDLEAALPKRRFSR